MAEAEEGVRCKADGEVKHRSNLSVVRILTSRPTQSDRPSRKAPGMAEAEEGVRCKADGEVKHRSNLSVVRILTSRPTQSDRPLFHLRRESALAGLLI